MMRLFQIIGDNYGFDATAYDVDGSNTVGWWEFVSAWKNNEFFVRL
jgi:hypothetical protein